jgi:hypothetical protein
VAPSTIKNGKIEEKSKVIFKVKLLKGWKLKFHMNFELRNPDINIQHGFIREDKDNKKNLFKLFAETYGQEPFDFMTAKDIGQTIDAFGEKYFDLDFPPSDSSVYNTDIDSQYDIAIHWRRPEEFFRLNYELGLNNCVVFQDWCDPQDIKPGILKNDWFISAVAILAERSELIERLFLTQTINPYGCYQIQFCKNGNWVTVTVDDLFPCFPCGYPIFSSAYSNEIWVLLLEKAYAKLHHGYYQLKNGHVN